VSKIVEEFKCGKSLIHNVTEDKDKVLNLWISGSNGNLKRKPRITGNEQIKEAFRMKIGLERNVTEWLVHWDRVGLIYKEERKKISD
jgi:hypothetical protein